MNAFITNTAENLTDTDLVQRSLTGDRTALELLIRRHQGFIYNLSLKLVLYPPDAEDVTQDVLIKVITHLSGFQGQSGFRTWLYRRIGDLVEFLAYVSTHECVAPAYGTKRQGDYFRAICKDSLG